MTRRVRRTAILVLLAVFLAGGLAGWVAEEVAEEFHWLDRHPGHDGERNDGEPLDDDAEERFLEGLGLTAVQLDSVDELLDRREDRLEDYWRSHLPDLQAVIDSSRQEIRALLAPGQRTAYDRWLGSRPGPGIP